MTTNSIPVLLVKRYAPDDPLRKHCEAIDATVVVANCDHIAWLSPHGRAKLDERPDVRTECENCIDPERLAGGLGVLPGSMEALEGQLDAAEMDRVRVFLSIFGAKENQ